MNLSASVIERITATYAYHPPRTEERVIAHERVRALFTNLALELEELMPASREASLAHTNLQYASMCAHAALAIHEGEGTF